MAAKLRTFNTKLGRPIDTSIAPTPEKVADQFYLSPEWRALMDRLKRERGDACEDPEHDDRLPRTRVRIFGDHIREIRDGGEKLDPANVMLRCGTCHARKTQEQRVARFNAIGA